MDTKKPTKKRKPFYPLKYDIVFRMFFSDERNEEELIGFLKSILWLPENEYESIEISDPHLLPDYIMEKYAIVDVKLHTKTKKIIHIEIQLNVSEHMRKRVVFYDAKLITEQIDHKEQYDTIQRVISIIITEENLIPGSSNYHHRFTLYDPNAGVEFSDILEIHTLELKKLPADTDGENLYDWGKLIAAETEEELDMITQRNPEMKKAIVKLRELSADEKARDMIERRQKGILDFNMFMNDAKMEGLVEGRTEERNEIALRLLKLNLPLEQIAMITGLNREEVDELRG